ncbi:MAG: helix-turn-helix transcriptional regulator [Clostridia bacterium]|nr:helix-turn-helix transcriptional regulator [Clostridia bacterium]
MNLAIGETIKRLRRERGITQETLAEYMNVSTPAVSKWERGETLPDITMIFPLASYFGVTADELLGFDAAKSEQKIQAILDEYHRLGAIGKDHEKFDLMMQAYAEFPNDWRIVEEYMWQLNYDPHHLEEPYGNEVHKDELYRLCDRVLTECTADSPRYAALSILGGLYVVDGQIDKAVETAKRFPPSYLTQEWELENIWERGSDEWWKQARENTWSIMYDLQVKIRNAGLYASDPAEQIRLLQKAIAVIELIFDDGDYGFCHYDLCELHLWIANRYVQLDDIPAALEHYEKGFAHAKQYDSLSRKSVHTSFLVRGYVQDMSQVTSGSQVNEVARELAYVRKCGVYEKVKDLPEMQAILAEYEPFAGEKRDYTKE